MPYSNSVYVGVSYKDRDRTLTKLGELNTNYILDLSNFNPKTRELLR